MGYAVRNLIGLRVALCVAVVALVWNFALPAQAPSGRILLSIPDNAINPPSVLIAYGDMRFTDTHETTATNPKVRRWLVDQIASECRVPLAG